MASRPADKAKIKTLRIDTERKTTSTAPEIGYPLTEACKIKSSEIPEIPAHLQIIRG